jgi:hypothetical protein
MLLQYGDQLHILGFCGKIECISASVAIMQKENPSKQGSAVTGSEFREKLK